MATSSQPAEAVNEFERRLAEWSDSEYPRDPGFRAIQAGSRIVFRPPPDDLPTLCALAATVAAIAYLGLCFLVYLGRDDLTVPAGAVWTVGFAFACWSCRRRPPDHFAIDFERRALLFGDDLGADDEVSGLPLARSSESSAGTARGTR